MKSNLRYYVLAIMMVICIIRLTYKEQTLPTKPIDDQTQITPTVSVQPLNPTVAFNSNIASDYTNNTATINTDSNTTLAEEDEPVEESCVEPSDIKLIKETSLDELKAQGWRFPQKTDYYSETYTEIKKYYKNSLEADFDNNGLKDKAVFMLRDNHDAYDGKEHALFVLLAQKQTAPKIFYMKQGEGFVYGGLTLQKPELFELGDCKIDLQSPALNLSNYESCGGEIMYWDKEQGKFLSIYTGC
ncbi:MAG: hypothetical protein HY819_18980 [Acidobacteria bacterium]|nr:hypothetical protein [Acidobacteriota bacterium]